jgi:hypothetical protein
MVGMPEMQEQFPAMTMDGRYAGMQSNFRRWYHQEY